MPVCGIFFRPFKKDELDRQNVVKLLLAQGADVNQTDDTNRTCLSYACEYGCNDIVRVLLEQNYIDPDITDKKGNTPLIYGAMAGNVTAVEILCRLFRRLGLNVEHKNNDGFTALLVAAKHGHKHCVGVLLDQGKASLGSKDNDRGLTAIEWLREEGYSMDDLGTLTTERSQMSRFNRMESGKVLCCKEKSNSM